MIDENSLLDALIRNPSAADDPPVRRQLSALLAAVPPDTALLHQLREFGGTIDPNSVHCSVLHIETATRGLHARVGVFFRETIGGCNCNDDPLEVESYGELMVSIDGSGARWSMPRSGTQASD